MSKTELIIRMNEHMKTLFPNWNMAIFAAKANEQVEPSHVYNEEIGAYVPAGERNTFPQRLLDAALSGMSQAVEQPTQIDWNFTEPYPAEMLAEPNEPEEQIQVPHSPLTHVQQIRWERNNPPRIEIGICGRCQIAFDTRQLTECGYCAMPHCDNCLDHAPDGE
jgi:hypothetical protein